MSRFLVKNFGCRTTQADGAVIERQLTLAGMSAARTTSEADLVVLNTCTVTASADDDARNAVRRVHRENPAARILVTGCYAQRAPETLAALPGVTWVVGNTHKARIAAIVGDESDGAPCHGQIHVGDILAERGLLAVPLAEAGRDRTRPNLKIQDGCNNRCTFCIIPSVRGRSRSAHPDAVVEQVRDLAKYHREVVLSGINLGRWGREPALRMRLSELVKRILDETDIERLRLSSVEPMDLSDDLLRLMASSPRMAQHVHAPLQSGSDAVLRRMRRWYRARHYASRVERARSWMPDAAIGADVLVGFPGETDEEFEETRRLIEQLPFTYLHVFTYSARPGAPAAEMPDQTPWPVRKERNRVLRELAAAKNLEFRRRFAGRTLSAVTLSQDRRALSSNYIEIELAAPREPNRIVEVAVGGPTNKGVRERSPLPVLP